MCFYIIYSDFSAIPLKKAEKDIVCWKVLKSDFFPIYFPSFKYEPGKSKRLSNDLWKDHSGSSVEYGFHSYSTKSKAQKIVRIDPNSCIIVRFIIPKGAEYFYNYYREEYVSNRIKCIKKVRK